MRELEGLGETGLGSERHLDSRPGGIFPRGNRTQGGGPAVGGRSRVEIENHGGTEVKHTHTEALGHSYGGLEVGLQS